MVLRAAKCQYYSALIVSADNCPAVSFGCPDPSWVVMVLRFTYGVVLNNMLGI